eukprot:XP_011604089.1 PREDICTED: tenascin-X [Takifugu rubripes]
MSALKERVARLEKEMSSLKDNCPCSVNCPNDCSGNGECQKGKCVCQQGFMGPDCSNCAQGAECIKKAVKGKAKSTGKTVTVQGEKDKSSAQTKGENTLSQDKEEKKVTEGKNTLSQGKEEKVTEGKNTLSRGKEEKKVTEGKNTLSQGKEEKKVTEGKNTLSQGKEEKKVMEGKNTLSQGKEEKKVMEGESTLLQGKEEKKVTEGKNTLSQGKEEKKVTEGKNTLSQGKEEKKVMEGKNTLSQGKEEKKVMEGESTLLQGKEQKKVTEIKDADAKPKVTTGTFTKLSLSKTQTKQEVSTKKTPTKDSGAAKTTHPTVSQVQVKHDKGNQEESPPQGMFKNFTLIRTESLTEGTQVDHEEFEEETFEEVKTYTIKNTTARVQVPTESSNTTVVSESRGKAETRRISMVIPGNVRSVEFSNLRPNTAYVLQIYGSAAQRRSKIHRVTTVTGPEPATEMVFSNVTESSLSVSWSKPKTTYAAFRITYTNIVTVPAPPTHLRVVNVTDTKALLQWTPSLGKVDRFIISYESSKTPNVTVTVMLSGNSVEHQLRGLQRGTMYTVKVLSQKDSHQSMAVSTTFTTANLVKASEVSARYAVIIWRTSTVVYHSYRLIYQVAGEETKEVILDGTMTEYKLTGLLPMSRYIVLVQGERDGRYTSIVTTEFITGKLRFPFPTDCSQELLNGALESGEVDIYPQGKEGRSVRVYCDMETDGGGWTVFQRRMNGRTDFYRTWTEYSAGFGNLSEEFWLGNDVLYNLTSVGPMSLRVDMRYGNKTVYAHYANFSIDSKERHYTLTVSGYTGNAGDSMRYHNSRPFSSWDKNPDPLGIHCARSYMGGWWYKNCYKTNLNGIYGANHDNQGIVWIDWKGKDVSIPFTEMKHP